MTYDEVKGLFGKEDRSPGETLLRLSAERPDFGASDLISLFETVRTNFRKGDDMNFDVCASGTSISKYMAFITSARQTRTYYSSDIVFRNVWRVMFETSEWDQDILFQPDFFGKFSEFVSASKPKPRRARRTFVSIPSRDAPERDALDFWEAMAEFQDALAEKIRIASGT